MKISSLAVLATAGSELQQWSIHAARVQWVVATRLVATSVASASEATCTGGREAPRAGPGQAPCLPVPDCPEGPQGSQGSGPAAGGREAVRSSLEAGGAAP